jgi:hypothetical protein
MPREGKAATFALTILAIAASTNISVVIETKNRGEADSAAATTAFAGNPITSGSPNQRVDNLKELVRLKFTVAGSGSFRFVHFLIAILGWERS